MADRKILFICEGESDEPDFLKRLMSRSYSSFAYEVYSYRTTIHTLASILRESYSDFADGDTDIRLILREQEPDPGKKAILSERYTDIILAFDFEPHHDHPDFDTVRQMLAYYRDSTDMGRLYINYPMMQSYKHFHSLPDPGFLDREADPIGYKELVGIESSFTDLSRYSYRTFASIALHNLRKAWHLLGRESVLPSHEDYGSIEWTGIFDIERKKFSSSRRVYVLNTLIFSMIDYNPASFFQSFQKHPGKYDF